MNRKVGPLSLLGANAARVLRTSSFRLATTYAAVFCASAAILLALIYVMATREMRGQVMDNVRATSEELIAQFREGGTASVVDIISDRVLGGDPDSGIVYLLQSRSGHRLAGTLGPMEPFTGWRDLAANDPSPGDDEDTDATAVVLGLTLPDGSFLAVGQDTRAIEEVQEAIVGVLVWGVVAALGLALVGGTLVSIGFLRRIDAINRTAQAIVAGNLNDRVPTRGAGDELDRLAVNVNGMLDRIQSLMEGLRQVSNDIAHDLRTPLTRLRQRLERARRDAASLEEYRRATDAALAEADGLLATFSALLRISQIEAGTRRAGFRTVDLGQVLQSVVEAYEAVAEEAGKTMTAAIGQHPAIPGDRELLAQMLVNLVENAIRHTPAGTHIRVGLERRGEAVEMVVADDGPGIPVSERDRVRERFVRLEDSRTSPGSGLGLALVAAVAELHGAELTLGDNGPGLRAAVSFPRAAG